MPGTQVFSINNNFQEVFKEPIQNEVPEAEYQYQMEK